MLSCDRASLEYFYTNLLFVLLEAAATELEKITLLLLLAAIKCERRDVYIRVIMDNLSIDVQKGIMECITNVTRCLGGIYK